MENFRENDKFRGNFRENENFRESFCENTEMKIFISTLLSLCQLINLIARGAGSTPYGLHKKGEGVISSPSTVLYSSNFYVILQAK
jgi:hypothetical protein